MRYVINMKLKLFKLVSQVRKATTTTMIMMMTDQRLRPTTGFIWKKPKLSYRPSREKKKNFKYVQQKISTDKKKGNNHTVNETNKW